jgi:hypothetical protein
MEDSLMAILSASYSITPSSPLIIELKDSELLEYEFSHLDYKIKITLPVAESSPKSGFVNSDYFKQFSVAVILDIYKEVEETPDIPINDRGGRDLYKLSEYFKPHKKEYAEVAIIFFQRLMNFFKYQLNQPYLDVDYINKDQFLNPIWSNDTGVNYGRISQTAHVKSYPGLDRDCLGITAQRKDDTSRLLNYLKQEENPCEIELHKQVMSDAQAAILAGNLRRGVFELAITCELGIKRTFFSADTFSSRAFDHFEDKGLLNVPLIDYIHKVALSVFGESFKVYSESDFKNIQYLISCRNKVAHRGVLTFKDNTETITPDQKMIEAWYASVKTLLNWLESKEKI